jgi:dihydroflavonol-4-reductase
MKIIITGASGHLGIAVITALKQKGHEPAALMRNPAPYMDKFNIPIIKGDICNEQFLIKAFRNYQAVIHLAAIIPLKTTDKARVIDVNINGVNSVINSCIKNNIGRLVHCSSIHAFYSGKENNPINESTRLVDYEDLSEPLYDRTKSKGQQAVADAAASGLDAVIVNPTAVTGPLDYKNSPLGRAIKMLIYGKMPATVSAGFNWVDVRDVANGIILALEKGKKGESYILGGHYATFDQLAKLIENNGGHKAPLISVPTFIAALFMPFAHLASTLTGTEPVFTLESLKILKKHQKIIDDKAKKFLGYTPRPLEETIKDTVKWHLSQTNNKRTKKNKNGRRTL